MEETDAVPLVASGQLEALEAEVVDSSEVAVGDFEDRIGGFVEEDLRFGAGELQTVVKPKPTK